ncbi:MAG: hypothetical protein A2054_05740 [Deltaproteobacteria bacterium GWA2_55_10]|nr:MAG: hypothetical protein A2054_05740 [Deltaproteobacteria bacterium GWA2_55_10]
MLPFYNATNDVGGPKAIREEFQKRIQHRHYNVMPLKDVDELLLNQTGITLGSQLELTNPAQLGEALGVDGVIYGYVLNFDDITTGVYNVKKVRAGFKLVDTRTGRVVWSRGLGVKRVIAGSKAGVGVTIYKEAKDDALDYYSTIKGLDEIEGLNDWHIIFAGATEKVEDAAIISLGEKLITKALGVHLWLETDSMMDRVMAGLPSGPGRPVAPDVPMSP